MSKLAGFFAVLLITFSCFNAGYAQRPARAKSTLKIAAVAPKPIDNYWSAQRNLETALAQLEKFLKDSLSTDEHRPVAADQIRLLKEIRLVPSRNQWSPLMNQNPSSLPIEWRVEKVEVQANRTTVTLEIRNTWSNRNQCFQSFNQNPLVLIDNQGKSVPLLTPSDIPAEVSFREYGQEQQWCLQGNQSLTISMDFAPLAPNTKSGQINYVEYIGAGAKPARFSVNK